MAGTSTFCSVCNLMLNSHEQFVAHQAGKAHKRKVAAGPPSASTPAASEIVTKIVRAKPFIRFVSSQEGSASSQNNAEGVVSETGQAGSSCQGGSATSKNNELYCSICVVKLTSQAMADIHYAGAKHRRAVSLSSGQSGGGDAGEAVKRKFEEVCEVCNVPLVSKVVAEAHYAGSKHEKRLRWSQNINPENPYPLFSVSTLRPACVDASGGQQQQKKAPAGMFFCHFCKVALNSQMQLDAHYQGSRHKNTVNKVPPQRKKPFTFRPPQEKPYTARPPPQEEQYVNPSHYPAGNFGNPNGFGNSNNFGNTNNFGNSNAPIPFRPMPPPILYPQY